MDFQTQEGAEALPPPLILMLVVAEYIMSHAYNPSTQEAEAGGFL